MDPPASTIEAVSPAVAVSTVYSEADEPSEATNLSLRVIFDDLLVSMWNLACVTANQLMQYFQASKLVQFGEHLLRSALSWVVSISELISAMYVALLARILSISFLGLGTWVNFSLSVLVSIIRFGNGNWAASGVEKCHRPEKLLILFDCEGSPECRRVREIISALGLDVIIFPIPWALHHPTLAACRTLWQRDLEELLTDAERETEGRREEEGTRHQQQDRHRPHHHGSGASDGKGYRVSLPVLVDPNVQSALRGGRQQLLMGSDCITQYLWHVYGSAATKPWNYTVVDQLESFSPVFSTIYRLLPQQIFRPLPSMGNAAIEVQWRATATNGDEAVTGDAASASVDKLTSEQPQLFGYENCPHTRLVRELLCSLQIPHVQRNIPRGCDTKRAQFAEKYGHNGSWSQKYLGALILPVLVTEGVPEGLRGQERILKYLENRFGRDADHSKYHPEINTAEVFRRAREVFTGTGTARSTPLAGTVPIPAVPVPANQKNTASVLLSPPYYAGSA